MIILTPSLILASLLGFFRPSSLHDRASLTVYYVQCPANHASDLRLYLDDLGGQQNELSKEEKDGATSTISEITTQIKPGVYLGTIASGNCADTFTVWAAPSSRLQVTAIGRLTATLDGGMGVMIGTLPLRGAHVSIVYNYKWRAGDMGFASTAGRLEIPAQTDGNRYWIGNLLNGVAYLRISSASLSSSIEIPLGTLSFGRRNRVRRFDIWPATTILAG